MKARAETFGRALALVFLGPVFLHLVGRGSAADAWLVLFLAGLPGIVALVGAKFGRRGAARDELAWFAAFGGAFVTPLLPTVFRIDGFDAPLVMASGALIWLAWHGRLTALTAAPIWGRRARVFFAVWAAWSVGSCLRGFFAYLPVGTPWTSEVLWAVVMDPYGYRSLVDMGRPFGQLFLRLEVVLFAWSGFELAMGALGRGEGARFESRMARVLGWSFAMGMLMSVAEFSLAAIWRGDSSVWARAAAGIGRNPRPLLDHNALGSALVLILPIALVGAGLLRRRGMWMWLASTMGMVLLVTSRSKSALAGFALAFALAAVFFGISRGGKMRRWCVGMMAASVFVFASFNLAPDSVIERISATRYGHDLVRVVRLDAASQYLTDNRSVVWNSAKAVAAEHSVVGVGLGRLPLLLGEHHDESAPGWFNPRHENAHSQYLQWLAEEGLVGLGLGLLFMVAAVLGGLRRQSSLSMAASAGICGLAFNLLVGHGLLVSSVALLAGGIAGWLIAGGSMTRVPDEAAGAAGRRPKLLVSFAAAAFVISLAPLALPSGRRPLPLSEATFGCYPWDFMAGQVPNRARTIGPDARWFETWGTGQFMKIPIRDMRDPRFEAIFHLSVFINDQLVLADWPLPHNTQRKNDIGEAAPAVNPMAYLRIRRPKNVAPGDQFKLRITCDNYFTGNRIYHPDHRRVAARMWPAFFTQ